MSTRARTSAERRPETEIRTCKVAKSIEHSEHDALTCWYVSPGANPCDILMVGFILGLPMRVLVLSIRQQENSWGQPRESHTCKLSRNRMR